MYCILLIITIIGLYLAYELQLKMMLFSIITIIRGILAPNCNWYRVSDLLKDGTGVDLYNRLKSTYGDFAPIHLFGTKLYLVTNVKYIKVILDHSPDLFGVGKLKMNFFKSFMSKNVGVSMGCPWVKRRQLNEMVLETDKLHIYASKYNVDLRNQLLHWTKKRQIIFNDFVGLGKKMVSKIVFNEDHVSDDVFQIFSEANSLSALYNPNFKINSSLYNNYIHILNKHITSPRNKSLIELCVRITKDREEIIHQIPHFIFPIAGLFVNTIPRLLLLLCNHRENFRKVLDEVQNTTNYQQIYKMTYLRKCILETLRLNNTVTTTFRTLEKNFSFDKNHSFEKGTQFVILNNPVLREKEFYKHPHRFIPSRWTPEMEQSYYAISFNQGPQRCPGKELAIYLIQSFMFHFIPLVGIDRQTQITTQRLNIDYIPQMINPCKIKFMLQ
tara:strand:- start:75 stop:1400 length:1326 start_codon:yes stop_codon:yes gene_type:complete